MATIPTYRTWTAGEIVTAAYMNSNIRDAGNFFLAKPYCEVSSFTAQALTSGTALLVNFDSENEDNDQMHDPGNPSRVTFNTSGAYGLHYFVRVPQPSGSFSSAITLNLRLNSGGSSTGGSSLSTTAYNNTSGTSTQVERYLRYRVQNVGDYYEVFVTASFSGTVSYSTGSRVTGTSAEWLIA